VILLTRERVKVRAKIDNLIVPHAAIRKSPILKAAVAAVLVLVAQLPPCKPNSLEYLLALSLFGMIFINTTPPTLGTVGMDSEKAANGPSQIHLLMCPLPVSILLYQQFIAHLDFSFGLVICASFGMYVRRCSDEGRGQISSTYATLPSPPCLLQKG
jgi:hypothetical protein